MPKNRAFGTCVLERLDEPGAERVPRLLAGRERDPQLARHARFLPPQRARPRVPCFNESRNSCELGLVEHQVLDDRDRLVELERLAEHRPVGLANVADLLRRKPAALETFGVDSTRLRGLTLRRDVRRNVLRHDARDAEHRVRADVAVLVHAGESAEHRMVADVHVARELSAVRENRVVADHAIVRDVHVRHDPVVVADRRDAQVLNRTAIDRAGFADRVAVADHEPRAFSGVLLVLRIVADRGELEDVIVGADHGRPFDHDVRLDAAAAANLDVLADDRVGADLRAVVDASAARNDGASVDHDLGPSASSRSASATTLPSTSARASSRHRLRRRSTRSTFRTIWSPGRTTCLNRTLSMPTR